MKKLLILMAAFWFLASLVPAYADLTVDQKTWVSLGNKRMLVMQVDFDSSYYTSGESLDWTELGFLNVLSIKATSRSGYVFEYDYTNKVLRAFTAGSEASVYADLSALTDVRVEIIGN